MSDPNKPEPAPATNPESVPVWPLVIERFKRRQRVQVLPERTGNLVIEDMAARDAIGTAKYGTPLMTHNGRDPLVDLYQELLDARVYAEQFYAEAGYEANGLYNGPLERRLLVGLDKMLCEVRSLIERKKEGA